MFRYYDISLNQEKDPLTPMYYVVDFVVRDDEKVSYNNLKLWLFPSDLQYNVKEVTTDYWDVFCEDTFHRPIRVFPL